MLDQTSHNRQGALRSIEEKVVTDCIQSTLPPVHLQILVICTRYYGLVLLKPVLILVQSFAVATCISNCSDIYSTTYVFLTEMSKFLSEFE